MRIKALVLALAMGAGPVCAADDVQMLMAELKRLAARVEALEKQNDALEKSLASERVNDAEPELATRLKAVESQTLAMQKQTRQIDALDGISIGGSLVGVVQNVNKEGAAAGEREARANYRGDLTVSLPGGKMGDSEGKIFTHLRFGQGNGVASRQTYSSTPNSTAFQVGNSGDDSFAILAKAWYQLNIPLFNDGIKADAHDRLQLTAGKIDPFAFFDQNVAADDESTKFLNNVFVHNPLLDSGGDIGADRYGFAPGAIVAYTNEHEKGAEWGLSVGVFGTAGNRVDNGANFNGGLGQPFVIAQAQTAARFNYLPGNYRVYVWHNGRGVGYDNVERNHSGIGFSADQRVTEELTLFGRYGQQLQGQARLDRALTMGAELIGNAWGRGADSLGFAVGALRTSNKFRNDSATLDADKDGVPDYGYRASGSESLFELYYRYQVNKHIELSHDLQWVNRPAGESGASALKFAGVRAKVGF